MSWDKIPLGEILIQSGSQRAGAQELPVLSITMKHGLVDQSEKFKKRIASNNTSNYRIAYRNELVVGFPIDEGVLGFQTKYPAGIVSPAYEIWKLKDEHKYHIPYIERYLRSPQARSIYASKMQGAVARRRTLTKIDFLELKIPAPPLDDQIRIAHLLGKVEGLIAQRKKHLQELDDLVKSVFLEMFGDPVRNQSKWVFRPLSELLRENPNNGLYKPQSAYGSGTKIVRIDSFYDSLVQNIDELKRVEISDIELEKYELKSSDILINRVNSIEYLGKIGVVPEILEPMVYESNMMRFRLNNERLHPLFLMHYWKTPFLKTQIISKAKRAVNQASINQQDVLSLLVPEPPIEFQFQFVSIAEYAENLRTLYGRELTDFESLYAALSQQAFNGKLDLSRVSLPSQPVTKAISTSTLPQAVPITLSIRLPNAPLLAKSVEAPADIKPLFLFWLEAYRAQLGTSAFSAERFLEAARAHLSEAHPEQDYELGSKAYEYLKTWVFESLAVGSLTQKRDESNNRVRIRATLA